MKIKPPVNGNFVTEGTFLAMPACFPGVSLPLEGSASRLQRLCLSSNGQQVYALTRGPEPHLLQFAVKGTFGYAVDLGALAGIRRGVRLVARPGNRVDDLVIASETETGCRLTARKAADLGHGIQEWHVFNPRREFHLDLPDSEILDISPDPDGNRIVVLTNQRCFWVDWGEESLLLANLPVYSMDRPLRALCRTSERGILGIGRDGYLYPLRQTDGIAPIPVLGLCDAVRVFPTFRGFLWVDADGEVFEWLDAADAVVPRGGIPLCPVHALALVPDGRIFAFAGEAIAHWFLLMGERTWARDLGVPVSTLSVRRYGLEFSELLVGPDGEIYAAEDDQGGHLWIYFPPIR